MQIYRQLSGRRSSSSPHRPTSLAKPYDATFVLCISVVTQVLNFIRSGLKEVLKSPKFELVRAAEALKSSFLNIFFKIYAYFLRQLFTSGSLLPTWCVLSQYIVFSSFRGGEAALHAWFRLSKCGKIETETLLDPRVCSCRAALIWSITLLSVKFYAAKHSLVNRLMFPSIRVVVAQMQIFQLKVFVCSQPPSVLSRGYIWTDLRVSAEAR